MATPPIPEHITVDGLAEKYADERIAQTQDPFCLNPIVGEWDDPGNQAQWLLTMPFSEEGNAIIYGAAGSGTETVLISMLYSLLKDHGPDTLNTYIMDFGAETLGVFRDAPQVGDIVFSGDDEKLDNLFKMLMAEMARRRKLLASVGGDRHLYEEQTGESIPSILVIVNGFETFVSLYEQNHLPFLTELTRDGFRAGIYFVITATRSGGIPFRVIPNFKQKIALPLNSKDEYISIFGSLGSAYPPKGYARGLVKIDAKIYEHQGAAVAKLHDELTFIRDYCANLKAATTETVAAACIPTLPEKVTPRNFGKEICIPRIPIGISKEAIKEVYFDFSKIPIFLAFGEDDERVDIFSKGLCEAIEGISDAALAIVDPAKIITQYPRGAVYCTDESDIVTLLEKLNAKKDGQKTLLIIPSISSVLDCRHDEVITKFKQFFMDFNSGSPVVCFAADALWKLSKYAFEPWYKQLGFYGSGIWIGNGITSQSVLRIGMQKPEHRNVMSAGFGYVVSKGNSVLVKHIQSIKQNEEGE